MNRAEALFAILEHCTELSTPESGGERQRTFNDIDVNICTVAKELAPATKFFVNINDEEKLPAYVLDHPQIQGVKDRLNLRLAQFVQKVQPKDTHADFNLKSEFDHLMSVLSLRTDTAEWLRYVLQFPAVHIAVISWIDMACAGVVKSTQDIDTLRRAPWKSLQTDDVAAINAEITQRGANFEHVMKVCKAFGPFLVGLRTCKCPNEKLQSHLKSKETLIVKAFQSFKIWSGEISLVPVLFCDSLETDELESEVSGIATVIKAANLWDEVDATIRCKATESLNQLGPTKLHGLRGVRVRTSCTVLHHAGSPSPLPS